jgi:ABC-2 type transport system ATP-binding protein
MISVTVDSLVKTYGDIEALRGLSFSVEEAAMYGIIGPDGAGKTTFMRIAACLLYQTSGRMTIGGFDTLASPVRVKRIIGYMPQRFSLYGDLTVDENLDFFADIYSVPIGGQRRARKEELLRFTNLSSFTDRKAQNLSGGMQKKLGLACNLIHTPEVLFLDEPTTGVDPISRREFWRILYRLTGVTVIVTTPYMDEAERCNRIGLIREGKLLICDTPAEIKKKAEAKSLEEAFINIIECFRTPECQIKPSK